MIEMTVARVGLFLAAPRSKPRPIRAPSDLAPFGAEPDSAHDETGEFRWFKLSPCSFAGLLCAARLLFRSGRLQSVTLAQLSQSGDWPGDEENAAELASWCAALQSEFGRAFRGEEERFSWGTLWLGVDPKAVFTCVVLSLESRR